jgi:hypothetical protein
VLPALLIFAGQTAVIAELITPSPDAPAFTLSNVRTESDRFDRMQISVDYVRTKKGEGHASLRAANQRGDATLLGIDVPSEDSGTIRMSQMFPREGQALNLEFYVIVTTQWADELIVPMLASNSVRIGNPGPAVTARPWNDAERAAYEKHQRGNQPPANPPAGYQILSVDIPTAPGMPVKAGYFGEWVDGELVSATENAVLVKRPDKQRLTQLSGLRWVAASAEVIEQVRRDPKSFTSSITVLPGGLLPIPDGAIPLAPNVRLYVGTPLLTEVAGQWKKSFVLQVDAKNVKVRLEGLTQAFDKTLPRSKFLIKQETLSRLDAADAAETFAANLADADRFSMGPNRAGRGRAAAATITNRGVGIVSGVSLPRKDYPVRGPIPRGSQLVPSDLQVEAGTQLGAFRGSRWWPVTVLSQNDDRTINVRWNDYGDTRDCSMVREQLLISAETLKKLQRTGPPNSQLSQLREWTDVTGRFKVQAKFVYKVGDEVTLQAADGREIKLSADKLSTADRALLAGYDAGK